MCYLVYLVGHHDLPNTLSNTFIWFHANVYCAVNMGHMCYLVFLVLVHP